MHSADPTENAAVLEALRAIPSERLRWCLDDVYLAKMKHNDPGSECWAVLCRAELDRRKERKP